MGKINDVRELIIANPGIERAALVGIVAEKFSITRALAHSYVYHASKKSARAPAAEKAVAAKKAPAKKAEPKKAEAKKDVASIKAKNLETLKKVAVKKKNKTEASESNLNPQLIREEVDQMIAEIDRNGGIRGATPKFMHKDFDGLNLSEV